MNPETIIQNPESRLQKAIEEFQKKFASGSFSERHRDLGKMINCRVCNRRHRAAVVCTQNYSAEANPRPKQIPRAKRYKQHHSKANLQLIEKTREIYSRNVPRNGAWFPALTEKELMKTSRNTAERELVEEAKAISKKKRRQRDVSRRINLGLLPGGSR